MGLREKEARELSERIKMLKDKISVLENEIEDARSIGADCKEMLREQGRLQAELQELNPELDLSPKRSED